MTEKADLTRERIIGNARKEFMEAGFYKASMRRIASEAGVTTGAIYRYFTDKDELFQAATADAIAALNEIYGEMTESALEEIDIGHSYNRTRSMENLAEIFEVIYEYFDQFYLLIMCSENSARELFLHKLVDEETKSTHLYLEKFKAHHHSTFEINYAGLHIIIESFITALLEPVRHRMPKEEAKEHIEIIGNFFADGWAGLEEKIAGNKTTR